MHIEKSGVKRAVIGAIVLFIVLFISPHLDAQDMTPFVKHDKQLLETFNDFSHAESIANDEHLIGVEIIDNEVWARVGVLLRDNSGVIIEGTKEERRELVNQKVAWMRNETTRLLSNLSMEGIKDIRIKNSGGFGALISLDGLNELINDKRIEEIIWSKYKPELILAESAPLINADDSWARGYNGTGVKVCIIDSGATSTFDLPGIVGDGINLFEVMKEFKKGGV